MNPKPFFSSIIIICLSIAGFQFASGQINSQYSSPGQTDYILTKSSYIFEGVVLDYQFYEDSSSKCIRTAYLIDILHVFRGQDESDSNRISLGTVVITTPGGTLGMRGTIASHTPKFPKYSRHIVFCRPGDQVNIFDPVNRQTLAPIDHIEFKTRTLKSIAGGFGYSFYSHKDVYDFLGRYENILLPSSPPETHPNEITREQVRAQQIEKRKQYQQSRENKRVPLSEEEIREREQLNKEREEFYLKQRENQPPKQDNKRGGNDVTFSLANPKVTNSSVRTFEFDINIQANNSTTYFDNALFRIQYDANMFGSNVVGNNNIAIFKGANFNSVTYFDPDNMAIDQNSNTIGVPFGSDFNTTNLNRTLVTQIPQQLLHIEIKLSSCVSPSVVAFTDMTFTPIFSFYSVNANDAITNTASYDDTFYQNVSLSVNCKPEINYFTPIVYGGTYYRGTTTNEWELRIEGKNFGNQVDVFFRDANNPIDEEFLNKEDYTLVSDSLILIRVPSIDINSLRNFLPGSGPLTLINEWSDSASTSFGNDLKIPYAIQNHVASWDSSKRRTYLSDLNGVGGYDFLLDTTITNYPDPAMEASIRKAMYEWSCTTGVNFRITGTTVKGGYINDTTNTIFLSDNLDSPGRTQVHFFQCFTPSQSDTFAYVTNIDIGFKREPLSGLPWFIDTSTISLNAGEADFYSAALHETGHATQLKHTNNLPDGDFMWYGLQQGPQSNRFITITQANIDGAFDILGLSTSWQYNSICTVSNSPHALSFPVGCSGQGLDRGMSSAIFLPPYPNPSESELNIFLPSAQKALEIQFTLVDCQGNIMDSGLDFHDGHGAFHRKIDTSILVPGIYILRIQVAADNYQAFKVVKL